MTPKPEQQYNKPLMVLLEAAPKDIIDLRAICIEAYSKNFHHHWEENGLEWYLKREFSTERLQTDLNAEDTNYYFITHEQQTVGFAKLREHALPNSSIINSVELEKIYVLPEYKGTGLGTAALKEVIAKIEKRGKQYLFLSVIDTNQNAIAFYEKFGFQFHSKTILDIPYFKEALKSMHRMVKELH